MPFNNIKKTLNPNLTQEELDAAAAAWAAQSGYQTPYAAPQVPVSIKPATTIYSPNSDIKQSILQSIAQPSTPNQTQIEPQQDQEQKNFIINQILKRDDISEEDKLNLLTQSGIGGYYLGKEMDDDMYSLESRPRVMEIPESLPFSK